MMKTVDIRKPVVINSRVEHVRSGIMGTCKCRRTIQRIDMVLVLWDGTSEPVWMGARGVRNCENSSLAW